MGNYICINCNYRFNSPKHMDCPYCGKNNIEKEKNAEELLTEVERLLRE